MLLKNTRLSFRLWLARLLLRWGRHEGAQIVYVSILNAFPDERRVAFANAGLAETEYRRGNFLNARHYARLFLDSVEYGAVELESPRDTRLHETICEVHRSSEEQYLSIRRSGRSGRAGAG